MKCYFVIKYNLLFFALSPMVMMFVFDRVDHCLLVMLVMASMVLLVIGG